MVVALNGLSKKARKWFPSQVYLMYRFRTLYNQQQAETDPQEKKRISFKLRHPQKKVEKHISYGISLGISEEQIRAFNSDVIAEMKKGKFPKAIIQALIKENGQRH
jgi:hypothetical protein